MQIERSQPSNFWAVVSVLAGLVLLLAGMLTACSYLGIPLLAGGRNALPYTLGSMAIMFVGLVCGWFALWHGLGALRGRRSSPFRLPPFYLFWLIWALVLGLGNLLLVFDVATVYVFPPLFLLGAALPTVAVLAWASRRLGWPLTWRQAALALVAGSTLSVAVTFALDAILSVAIFYLIAPLRLLSYGFGDVLNADANFMTRLFLSPLLIAFLVTTALQAPIPEEFAKALGIVIFGRQRISSERQAFMLGLVSGAGFAILENMLYEGVYAQQSGLSWGGITLLRGIGSVLHPLCTGLVALGWFRMKRGGLRVLLKHYFAAVGLHTLWNGGFAAFVYVSGMGTYARTSGALLLYGTGVQSLLVVFLLALSLSLWWLLRRQLAQLGTEAMAELLPQGVTPRALAAWAFACAVIVVPIGAVIARVWNVAH